MKPILKGNSVPSVPAEEFAVNIDFQPLYNFLEREVVGFACEFETPEVVSVSADLCYIRFNSKMIVYSGGKSDAGTAGFAVCKLSGGDNQVTKDEKTGQYRYCVSVDVNYLREDGGYTGTPLCIAEYGESTGWIFNRLFKPSKEGR